MVWFECVTSYLHLSNRVVGGCRMFGAWICSTLRGSAHEHLVFIKGWDMMGCSFFAAEVQGLIGVADLSKESEHLSDTPHAKMESFGRELPIVVSLALFAMLIISCRSQLTIWFAHVHFNTPFESLDHRLSCGDQRVKDANIRCIRPQSNHIGWLIAMSTCKSPQISGKISRIPVENRLSYFLLHLCFTDIHGPWDLTGFLRWNNVR